MKSIVNLGNQRKDSALHFAVIKGACGICKELVEVLGADCLLHNSLGVIKGACGICKELVEVLGADCLLHNSLGNTALDIAKLKKMKKLVKLLEEHVVKSSRHSTGGSVDARSGDEKKSEDEKEVSPGRKRTALVSVEILTKSNDWIL
jgi:ankyrin repeat protein